VCGVDFGNLRVDKFRKTGHRISVCGFAMGLAMGLESGQSTATTSKLEVTKADDKFRDFDGSQIQKNMPSHKGGGVSLETTGWQKWMSNFGILTGHKYRKTCHHII